MHPKLVPSVIALLSLIACSKEVEPVDDYDAARDYFTFANTDQFVTEHLALDLDVDFEAEELRGYATQRMRRLDATATEIVAVIATVTATEPRRD